MLRSGAVAWAAARAAERTRENAAAMNLIVGVCVVWRMERGRATTDEGETNFGRKTKPNNSFHIQVKMSWHYKVSRY